MTNEIVEVRFSGTEKVYFAIYRGFDGGILTWQDLSWVIDEEKIDGLPESVKEQIGTDGTALFETREDAEAVLERI